MARVQAHLVDDDEVFNSPDPLLGSTDGIGADRVGVTFDAGLNYIIDGHNARLSLVYQRVGVNIDGASNPDPLQSITFAGQLQL